MWFLSKEEEKFKEEFLKYCQNFSELSKLIAQQPGHKWRLEIIRLMKSKNFHIPPRVDEMLEMYQKQQSEEQSFLNKYKVLLAQSNNEFSRAHFYKFIHLHKLSVERDDYSRLVDLIKERSKDFLR